MVRVCSIRDIECARGCTNVCQREFDTLMADRDLWKGRADQLQDERDTLEAKLDAARKAPSPRDPTAHWYRSEPSPGYCKRSNNGKGECDCGVIAGCKLYIEQPWD